MAQQQYAFGVQAKLEATRGTYIAPTDPLCLLSDTRLPSPSYQTETIEKMTEFDADSYDIVQDPDSPAVSFSVSHWMPLAMKDSAANVVSTLIQACGMEVEAITAPSAGFKFKHVTRADTSVSLLATAPRFATKYKGGHGNFEIGFELDKALKMEFTISATQDGATTELSAGANDNSVPALALGGATDVLYYNSGNPATINGAPACIKDARFVQGNNLAEDSPLCGKTRDITKKVPKISFTQKLTEAFEASFNDVRDGTEFNIVIPVSDRSGNEVGQFVFPRCVVDTNSDENKDGMLELSRTLSCRSTAGDDNYYFELYT